MASQAAFIEDTIVGLKRALHQQNSGIPVHASILLKRTMLTAIHPDPESDDPINHFSNRGKKTKLYSQFIREGALGYVYGAGFYKKNAEHSGYNRDILCNNPPQYDAEGEELDVDDSDATADLDVTEENPFSATNLASLLSPLSHPSELPAHSMANAYTNKALNTTVERIDQRLRSERCALMQAKTVYRQLLSDAIWMPCGATEVRVDSPVFGPALRNVKTLSKQRRESLTTLPASLPAEMLSKGASKLAADSIPSEPHGPVTDVLPDPCARDNITVEDTETSPSNNMPSQGIVRTDHRSQLETIAGQYNQDSDRGGMGHTSPDNLPDRHAGSAEDWASQDIIPECNSWKQPQQHFQAEKAPTHEQLSEPHSRITTRAQVSRMSSTMKTKSPAEISIALSPHAGNDHDDEMEIHPLYRLPRIAHLDPTCGLPQNEADETRHMLWAYIQKQGETVRLFAEMLDLLLKAQRMKQDVWEWCTSEAHVGEMSDGEDWYDKDRWRLNEGEDLRKGTDEEEAESVEEGRATGKRGRGRRA
ncbi:hypothetical protein FQN57_003057 [Myotisia sp. PD_48]|nr:hypothetical protein FQN57_003057 [Myotisia sp. PD_48]